MQQFLKQPGPDPAIRTPNDSAAAMFGHLNVLVNAITALQNAPPPPTFLGWELNGNNTLPSNAYIGSNDPLINDFQIIMNNTRYLFLSGNTLSTYVGQESGKLTDDQGANIAIGRVAGFNSLMGNSIMIGNGAGFANVNPGSLIAIGGSSAESNVGSRPIFIGNLSGIGNVGNENIGIGENVLKFNTGNYVIAIGKNAGYNPSTLTNNQINNITMVNSDYLPEYANHTAALAAITILNGGVPGTTYLYRRSSDNSIGYVSL